MPATSRPPPPLGGRRRGHGQGGAHDGMVQQVLLHLRPPRGPRVRRRLRADPHRLDEQNPERDVVGPEAIAGPDGQWIAPPVSDEECLVTADIDPAAVRAERHNFDPTGHYARADVLHLQVDRRRPGAAEFLD
ncbi:hypothetical protein [Actinomadura soli]|uniref:hypothetical protein n=1 Tax=Actinomadura soli TaxID=2508997 RepID=UPI00197AA191|nr:hypothetical protein [Actinomadura soli]